MTELHEWLGKTETKTALIDERQAELMAATLDVAIPKSGNPLPACWHWSWFNTAKPHSELGRDGHPKRGTNDLLPPTRLPRRMWGGGNLEFLEPIYVGKVITKKSTIEKISEKSGNTGPLCIITILHEIFDEKVLCIKERQNLIFREDPTPNARQGLAPQPPQNGVISRQVTPDPVTMFRYSALTFNGHRIHYDVDYARDIEGYDGLVIPCTTNSNAPIGACPGDCRQDNFKLYLPRNRSPVWPPKFFHPRQGRKQQDNCMGTNPRRWTGNDRRSHISFFPIS